MESFVYQKKVDNEIQGKANESGELEEFVNSFQIFVGIVFNESTKLFIKTQNNMVQHDPICDHGDFYQTNLVRKQLLDKKTSLQKLLSKENNELLEKHFAHIQKVFDSVVHVFKKMYGNGEFYFTYSEAQKFTDRKEFVDIFKNKVIFFTNTNLQASPINALPQVPSPSSQSIKVMPPIIDKLVAYIVEEVKKSPENISYFVFSPKKEESKKIFEDLCQNHINDKATLLIENITGGIGKNIYKAKQTKNKILIG